MRGCGALAVVLLGEGCGRPPDVTIPVELHGVFVDDYGTGHTIDDSLWVHGPRNRYHLVEWHPESGFVLARNDVANVADGGRYDRIDWLMLRDGNEWTWAFCIATWDAPSLAAARAVTLADTTNPRSGCGGYPFTRMRRSATAPPPGAPDE